MISILIIGRICILGCQKSSTFVVIRVEDVVIWEFGFIMMETPDIEEDCCAFGDEFTIYPFIWT